MKPDQDNKQKFSDRLGQIQAKHAPPDDDPARARGRKRKGPVNRGPLLAAVAIPVVVLGLGYSVMAMPEKFTLTSQDTVAEEKPEPTPHARKLGRKNMAGSFVRR